MRDSAKYKELQTSCARQSDELASHVMTITDLEREKSDLVQGRPTLVLEPKLQCMYSMFDKQMSALEV